MGSVVVPAHNEASVILRTLEPLGPLAVAGRIDLIVAANGCSDATVAIARGVVGVRVLNLPEASKVSAISAAEAVTNRFPRMYLDADIEIEPAALVAVFSALDAGPELAARPPFIYDTVGASWPVRAYIRARMRLPSNTEALWGAGCYSLSRTARERFGEFPPLIADDYFVDSLFDASEKRVVPTTPVVVRAPRTAAAMRAVLRRTYSGNTQLQRHLADVGGAEPSRTNNARDLMKSVRSMSSLADACVYLAFVLVGRVHMRRRTSVWSRDQSTRL